MREREIERVLVTEIRKLGGRAYKWVSPGNDGVPDRIVFLPGQAPIFVELKAEGGKVSNIQAVQMHRLTALGQKVELVVGIDGLSQFFQDLGFEEVSKALDCKYEL